MQLRRRAKSILIVRLRPVARARGSPLGSGESGGYPELFNMNLGPRFEARRPIVDKITIIFSTIFYSQESIKSSKSFTNK